MCEYPHVVVTGASSGTGRAVALCLAASGYHVFAGVRTHAGGVALHQHTPPDAGLIAPLLLDVTRPIQVMAAVRAVTAHTGPGGLAGLVNEAGTDGFGPRPAVSVTGELAVIRAFVPLLRRAESRIVLIEPDGARLTPPLAGPLTAMSATLRAELAPWPIEVTLTEPGSAGGAITRALTARRPRAASASPWFGLYDVDPASSASLRAEARGHAPRPVRCTRHASCATSWLTHVSQDPRWCDVGPSV
jgi:NAD(P)-dependent dehydrogenase (short-subunit alcohol dehydrogenase family)